jgi:hypothetical protein
VTLTAHPPLSLQVIGPTLGLVVFVVGGVVCWPVGALVYLVNHSKGRRLMSKPLGFYTTTKSKIHI